MVTLIALLAIMGGIFIRVSIASGTIIGSDEEEKDLKELSIYLILGGVVIILINSWVVKPIMMIFGG